MRRLSGEDSGFLSMELPTQPMTIMVVAVLRPATGSDGTPAPLTLDEVRRHLIARLDDVPVLRWRVLRVPFGLHHPVFVEDPSFELENHLSHTTVPAPGGRPELDRLVAGAAEHRLDRRRPLWHLTLVDGLENGRQALIIKLHHCLMDGAATVATLAVLFSDDQLAGGHRMAPAHRAPARETPWPAQVTPTKAQLIGAAIRDHGRTLVLAAKLTGRSRRGLKALRAFERRTGTTLPKAVADTPPCSLNDAFTVGRVYARLTMSLDAVMLVKETADVTVNDVALAVVAGALRHYLQAREDLPTRPLVANVPVAVPTGEMPPRTFGNRFSNLTTTLATDVADPWTRLRVISEVTALAKQGHALLGPELLPDWLECVPPFVAEPAVRRHHRSRSMNRDKADASIAVSTVRSSPDRWSFASAGVDEVTFGGPPTNGTGSNIVMFTNCNRVDVGILSVADSLRDPQELAEGIQRALDELVASARARAATVTESMEREAPGVAEG